MDLCFPLSSSRPNETNIDSVRYINKLQVVPNTNSDLFVFSEYYKNTVSTDNIASIKKFLYFKYPI
jgi:hypothetical protein